MKRVGYYDSVLGRMLMIAEEEAICGLYFEGQRYYPQDLNECVKEDDDTLNSCRRWLDEFFSGKEPSFIPKLQLSGTAFQKKVYETLLKIPYGKTISYKRLGEMMALQSYSCQAIGSAVGHNPISLIVPCHRVIGADGSLKGYAGGIERKRYLVEMERRSIEER